MEILEGGRPSSARCLQIGQQLSGDDSESDGEASRAAAAIVAVFLRQRQETASSAASSAGASASSPHHLLSGGIRGSKSSSGLLTRSGFERCPALAFVDKERFQTFMGGAVIANLVQQIAETDWPSFPGWAILGHLIFLTFATELALLYARRGPVLFSDAGGGWARFDALIVALVLLSMCLTPVLTPTNPDGQGKPSQALQLLMMSRIGWSLRIFRVFPRLASFMWALFGMGATFLRAFVVLFLLCLVSAIVCTQIIGKGDFEAHTAADEENIRLVRQHFGSVRASLFSLFQVTTQDNWGDIAKPTVALLPHMRIFFVWFIIICSWTMISILTAVASDSMIEAATDRKALERQAQVLKQQHFIKYLRQCFVEADADGSGTLDKDEFESLVQQPEVIQGIQALGGAFTSDELGAAWRMLDVQDMGELTIDAFVDGISYLHDSLSTKHVVGLEGKVRRTGIKLQRAFAKLEAELEAVRNQHESLEGAGAEIEALVSAERQCLEVWSRWAKKKEAKKLEELRQERRKKQRSGSRHSSTSPPLSPTASASATPSIASIAPRLTNFMSTLA